MNSIHNAVAIIITLPLVLFVPGFFLLRTRASAGLHVSRIERYVLMVVVSVGISSILALFLAELGTLSLKFLISAILAVSLAIRLLGGHNRRPIPGSKGGLLQLALVLFLVVLAAVLFFHPAEYVSGDGDPGIHFNAGYRVAQSGAINFKDEGVASWNKDEAKAFLYSGKRRFTFIGFSVRDLETGKTSTPLYHMLPSWIGIFIRLFGMNGGLYVNCLFAVLSVILAYCIGRRLTGTFGGLAAAVLMAACSLQIWFARIPDAEILAQFFMLAGFLVMIMHFDHEHRLFPWIFGLSFTGAFLAKVENLVFLAPIALAFIVRMLLDKYRRADRMMLNAALAAAAFALLYDRLFFFETVRILILSSLRKRVVIDNPNSLLLIIGVLFLVALLFNWGRFARLLAAIGRRASSIRAGLKAQAVHWFRALAALLTLAFFIYLYALPGSTPDFNSTSTNLLRLSWMMGGAFFFIAVVGLCALIYESDPAVSCFVFFGVVFFMYFFVVNYAGQWIVPWETRRYVTFLMPVLVIGAGYLAHLFWARRFFLWKLIGVGIVVTLLFSFFPVDRVVMKGTHYGGIEKFLTQTANVTPDVPVVMAEKITANIFGMPLRYIYGKDFRWLNLDTDYRKRLGKVAGKYESEGKSTIFALRVPVDSLYRYTPWVSFADTGQKITIKYAGLKHEKDGPPTKWGKGIIEFKYYIMHPDSPVRLEPGSTFTFEVPNAKQGYTQGFVVRKKGGRKVYWVRGLEPDRWRGVDSLTLEIINRRDKKLAKHGLAPLVSRVKLPIMGSDLPLSVSLIAGDRSTPGTPLKVLANGKPVPVKASYRGNQAVYSLVISPSDQLEDYQELVLLSPFNRWVESGVLKSPLSGITLSSIEASH